MPNWKKLITSGSDAALKSLTATDYIELTGSLNVSGSTTQIGNNNLFGNTTLSGSIIISGSDNTADPAIRIYGDTQVGGVIRFDPINTTIDTSISASYIYVSGSTEDLYFSQNGRGYSNVTRLRWLEGNVNTGLLYGGIVSGSAGGTTFNVSAGEGLITIMNAFTSSESPNPVFTRVKWDDFTNITPTYLNTNDSTWLLIDSNGDLVQQTVAPTELQFRSEIQIGVLIHPNKSTINLFKTFTQTSYASTQQIFTFIRSFGGIKLSGHEISANGANLSINRTSGESYAIGRNYAFDPNDPSLISDDAYNAPNVFRYHKSGSTFITTLTGNVIDPDNYNTPDIGTGLSAMDPNKFQIQRIFFFPKAEDIIGVYYGRQQYGTIAQALQNLPYEAFEENENTRTQAIFLGYLIVESGTTDLTDGNRARFIQAGSFRTTGVGGGGSAPVVTNLEDLNDVSIASLNIGDLLLYNGAEWQNSQTGINITGSLFGNASTATSSSFATTASYAESSNISGDDIVEALGYIPYSEDNPSNFIILTDLTSSIVGLNYNESTGEFTLASGYSIPIASSQSNWDTAYTNRITNLTTNGNSGNSTLISNTLNIPEYTLVGLGGVTSSRTLTINDVPYDLSTDRSWSIPTHSAVTLGTANGLSISDQQLSLALASTSTTGSLSSVDWNTFNNKANSGINTDITSISLSTGTISTTPTSSNGIVNKEYVDTVAAQALHYHEPVFVETPNTFGNLNATYDNGSSGVGATLTNAGTQEALVIDGVLMTVGKRVLVYNQSNGFENGVYTVTTVGDGSTNWVLTRALDADTYTPSSPNSLGQGDAFYVTSGNTGTGETYLCNVVGEIIFGTTDITFIQISSPQVYSAGDGLNLTDLIFSISDIGTAGTYGSSTLIPVITTNAKGQVTSVTTAANPQGTITSITATSPLTGGTITSTGTVGITQSTTSTNGYLSSTDWNTFNNKGNGSVTTVSVVSSNGLAGTVSNATTTPAITLSTTITGLLKGNGTAISAATVNEDYQKVITVGTTPPVSPSIGDLWVDTN